MPARLQAKKHRAMDVRKGSTLAQGKSSGSQALRLNEGSTFCSLQAYEQRQHSSTLRCLANIACAQAVRQAAGISAAEMA